MLVLCTNNYINGLIIDSIKDFRSDLNNELNKSLSILSVFDLNIKPIIITVKRNSSVKVI